MRIVSTNRNYEVRANKSYGDEIGRLIDGFNTMLSEIQQRDTAAARCERSAEVQDRRAGERSPLQKTDAGRTVEGETRGGRGQPRKSTFLANMSHELADSS